MFERLRKWLNGSFVCQTCGKKFSIMSFGYGSGICPNCYNNEKTFLSLDLSFILNRILRYLYNQV